MSLVAAAVLLSTPADFKKYGIECLEQIRREFYLPESKLYADSIEGGKKSGPAFLWGAGVMLSALNAAARVDVKYKPWLLEYAEALQVHWTVVNGIGGYDVLPAPKPSDRYYDDNAWMALQFQELFELTRDEKHWKWAEQARVFARTGMDNVQGGGIYWHENTKRSKNTCATAPTLLATIRYCSRDPRNQIKMSLSLLLEMGWLFNTLQDPSDMLFWDNISVDGKVEKTKWSYNTAIPIRCETSILRGQAIRADQDDWREMKAKLISRCNSAVTYWVLKNGSIRDDAAFAHLLAEALLEVDSNGYGDYKDVVDRALQFLHDKGRDGNGHYPHRWEAIATKPLEKVALIDQASAARAFFMAAAHESR